MKWIVLAVPLIFLGGCAALDWFFATGPGGGTGDSPKPSDLVGTLIGTVLPWGGGALATLRWGYVEWRHQQLVAAGKKDSNRDGIDDAVQAPPKT